MFRVQPIIARRQMLCTICILFIFVSDMIGNYIVFAYSMTGWITVLQVLCSVSLYLSQVVAANVFMICICNRLCFCLLCGIRVGQFGVKSQSKFFGSCVTGSIVSCIVSRDL